MLLRKQVVVSLLARFAFASCGVLLAEDLHLNSAHAVHSLTLAQARHAYPVHLRLTTVVYMSGWHALFAHDASGGIFVEMRGQPPLPIRPGTIVDVDGVTAPGDFAPIVEQRSVQIVGQGTLPPAPRHSIEHLFTAIEDGQWVEIEGVVRSVEKFTDIITLVVANGSSQIEVNTIDERVARSPELVDASVRIRGSAGPVFNTRRQMIGVNIYSPGMDAIQIVEPAPRDPFSLPVHRVSKLLQYEPGEGLNHRVRIQGVVTAVWPGKAIFVSDATQGISVAGGSMQGIEPGSFVDVAGFPSLGAYSHQIQGAVVRRLHDGAMPAAKPATTREALTGDLDGDLIRLKGRLLSRQRSTAQYSLLVEEGGNVFTAILPGQGVNALVEDLRDGSFLELDGICLIQDTGAAKHFRIPKGFQLLLRSDGDIRVLGRTSWWTRERALAILGLTALAILAALAWVGALRRRVRRQTRVIEDQLREAAVLKTAAEGASRAKSDFLANMSHEIRTPINGIMGLTDLVLDTQLTQPQRECLELVKTSSDSLLTIINDVLDFSKIEAGKLALEQVEFNLRDSIEETVRTFSLRAAEKRLELTCDVKEGVPENLVGDPVRLRQVILNLIGNAVKFTERGAVAIEVFAEQVLPESIQLHFVVRDTGVGVEREQQQLIFEAFTQADASTTRKFGGTGLGLSICTRLVALMEGRIWLESEPGQGSSFHFTARFDPGASVSEGLQALDQSLAGVRILLVDHHPPSARILSDLMARWGVSVVQAANGVDALATANAAAAAGVPFQLAMSDDPEFVKALGRKRDMMPVIALLAGPHFRDALRFRDSGFSGSVTKPVRRRELFALISTLLKGSGDTTPVSVGEPAFAGHRPLRILVAEDNAVNQQLARRLLEKHGHTVFSAGNGREALLILADQKVELVLMDVQMPVMDGLEATATIREKEKVTGDHQIIVATTAFAMKGDEEKCMAAGMDGYISKPIRLRELFAWIEKAAAHEERLTIN